MPDLIVQTPEEAELAMLMVETLNLEMNVGDLDPLCAALRRRPWSRLHRHPGARFGDLEDLWRATSRRRCRQRNDLPVVANLNATSAAPAGVNAALASRLAGALAVLILVGGATGGTSALAMHREQLLQPRSSPSQASS